MVLCLIERKSVDRLACCELVSLVTTPLTLRLCELYVVDFGLFNCFISLVLRVVNRVELIEEVLI